MKNKHVTSINSGLSDAERILNLERQTAFHIEKRPHEIIEGYKKYIYDSSNRISKIIVWDSNSENTKIQEISYTYNDVNRNVVVENHYFYSGKEGKTYRAKYEYNSRDQITSKDGWLLGEPVGYSGTSGYSGTFGYSGGTGYSGTSGTSGQSGYTGASGASGTSGYSGYTGASGISGYSGVSGFTGYSGTSGISGWSGTLGISGYSGYSGAVELNILTKTANYTMLDVDDGIECTTNTFTITLQLLSGATVKRRFITNSGTGIITVDGNGIETINGELTQQIAQYDTIEFVNGSIGWMII